MTAPLEDKRLEAAAQIINGGWGSDPDDLETARNHVSMPETGALAILSTAIRETHASELAEILEELLEFIGHATQYELENFRDYKTPQKAMAIIAKFKEIANG